MNITLKTSLMCVGKNAERASDGKSTFYNLAVVQAGQAGNIPCTEDVYCMALASGASMEQCDLMCLYRDGQYKGMRVVSYKPCDSSTVGGSSQSTSAREKK